MLKFKYKKMPKHTTLTLLESSDWLEVNWSENEEIWMLRRGCLSVSSSLHCMTVPEVTRESSDSTSCFTSSLAAIARLVATANNRKNVVSVEADEGVIL